MRSAFIGSSILASAYVTHVRTYFAFFLSFSFFFSLRVKIRLRLPSKRDKKENASSFHKLMMWLLGDV